MIRAILYFLAALLLIGPVVAWLLVSSMSCAYVTAATACGIKWHALLDHEFFSLATIPWILGAVFLFYAIRMSKSRKTDQ